MNILSIILFFQIFFLPGLVVYIKKEKEIGKMIVKVIISSLVVNIFSFSFIFLIRNIIDLKLFFIASIFSFLVSFLLRKIIKEREVSLKILKNDLWLLLLLSISFLVNFTLFFNQKSIVGADVGRFGIISHSIFLKGKFETNLEPYDMAKDFFYFPSIILIPPLFEMVEVNPITFLSFLVFFFSSLYALPIYLITKKLFNEDVAISSFFFSSFLFNPLINIGFFGVFPYAISIFFFLSLLYFVLENKKDFISICTSLMGLISFHMYPSILLIPFLMSLLILDFQTLSSVLDEKFWKFFLFFSLFFIPYFLNTYPSLFVPFQMERKLDIFMFSTFNRNLSLKEKLQYILFSSPIGFNKNILLVVGLIVFLFSSIRNFRRFKFGIKFLTLSFILCIPMLLITFNDMNLARSIWINWFFYSIGLGLLLNDKKLNLLILALIAITKLPPSIFSYFELQATYEKGQIPWVVWSSFYDAIDFIKQKTPEDSIFLIDGGGAGCTGASASYGERIFPLTSRKIFYFSDYCWAQYDEDEYRKKVTIYREFSINPSNIHIIQELKRYGITHVFIGPTDVGLDKNLFNNSSLYKLIYENKDFKIFKIL
jgi:hypothetical protein